MTFDVVPDHYKQGDQLSVYLDGRTYRRRIREIIPHEYDGSFTLVLDRAEGEK